MTDMVVVAAFQVVLRSELVICGKGDGCALMCRSTLTTSMTLESLRFLDTI